MNEALRKEYQSRLMSAQEAVGLVKSGDTVYLGASSSVAYGLCQALGQREHELEGIRLVSSQVFRPLRIMSGEVPGAFHTCSFFMGPQERVMRDKGLLDYTSVNLSQVDIFCRETAPADVAFFEVSPPDENGYMSFGGDGVALNCYVQETARCIILQVNRHVPYVYGESNLISLTQADAIVELDMELVEYPNPPFDDTIRTISDYILEQIPDGACLQLGVGGVTTAVGFGLADKNDLGIHSELFNDSMMELTIKGVVNNSRKDFFPGKSVAAFAFGSKALYQYLDYNPGVYFMPFPIVNSPINIAKNKNMISVNSAMCIDLMGQVCADHVAGKQHSATGGQLDFVRGAQLSPGGKSFIAMTSSYQSKTAGRQSRIVTRLPVGSAVTTPRSEVQYVVTEYGCVNLKPLVMRDRVRALIGLAHPDFRAQLTEEARQAGLL